MNKKSEQLDKKSIFQRIYQHIDFSLTFRWDNLIIAILSSILLYYLVVGTGIIDFNTNLYFLGIISEVSKSVALYIKKFFLLEIFIILFLIRKIPLKVMGKQVVIFAVFLSIAFLTTYLCRINFIIFILVSLFWIIVFIYTQQNENLSSVGSFTAISYVFYLTLIIPLDECSLLFMVNGAIIVFIAVLIASIPMFIVRIIQGDPYRKELVVNLFKKPNSNYELNKNKNALLKIDQSNYTKSIINIAEELFALNTNLNTLSLNLDYKEEIDQFRAEINRLTEKIKFAINNSIEEYFELNVSRITEFYKDSDYEVKSGKNKNQSFLNFMSKKYKNLFERLNDVFERKYTMGQGTPVNLKESNINNSLKTNSVEFRYSVRFVIILLICFIWDYINKNLLFTATLISFFTLTTNLIFNSEVFLIRVYATVMAVVIGIGILLACSFLNIVFIIAPLSTIAFLLFFLFKDNGYRACFLFLLGFILWSPHGTIHTSTLFIVNGILSLIVIILIFNFVMPKRSKTTNIITLLIYKIDLTKQSIREFYNQGFEEETLEKLRENNIEINNILNKLDDKYKNINDELELLNDLNRLIEDFGYKVLSIKLILDDKNINYNDELILREVDLILNSFKNMLEGKEINDEFESSDDLKENISKDKFEFIYPILRSIELDGKDITNILIKLNNEELIEKYDKNLIKNVFNVKDIYATN